MGRAQGGACEKTLKRDPASWTKETRRDQRGRREARRSYEETHVKEGRHRQAVDAGGRRPHGELGGLVALRLGKAREYERFEAQDVLAAM